MEIDIKRRSIGVNFNGRQATVNVWAPEAKQVCVLAGDKELPMKSAELGFWHLTTTQFAEGAAYRFRIDDGEPLPDPASLAQPDGVHGASRALDLAGFSWTDGSWNNIPLEQYLIYELHTGTFTPEGTFAALEQKLDHLLELGINAIEIMPVAQFPGNRNWGYDGVYPFAVQDSYGGAEALQQLVNRCHEKGIAVVLDVVYNHMGPEGNYMGAFGPFFTSKYNTPWGGAINFDDAWCDGVRQFFIENVLMWFRDFHIDALRLDAVHAIRDFSPNHILAAIRHYTDQLMKETGRTHYLIVECDLNDTRFINPPDQQGYGMDAQWIDEFHHSLRTTADEPPTGYYSDFTGLPHLAKAYADAYVYDGQWSEHRRKKFGVKATENPGKQFIVFSQNHDQVGNRMLGERTGTLLSFEMQKLLAGAVMVSPFIPMLFMGEEWSEQNPFLYFVSHTDPELAEAVRTGRREEFAAFHGQDEAPDPMAQSSFEKSKLQWRLLGEDQHHTMFRYYQRLIGLRKTHPVLSRLDRNSLNVSFDEQKNVLTLHRWHQQKQLRCFLNFSEESCAVTVADDTGWHCLLNSADPEWKGPSTVPDFVKGASSLMVPAASIVLYEHS
jgi:maltooligosyltrehalose trehalohydrolase